MWPGLFIFFTGSHRARVIVLVGDEVLLVKDRSELWFDDTRWSLPGGGIHRNESPVEGGARELLEEVGVLVRPGQIEQFGHERVSEYGLSYDGYFMFVRLPAKPELKLQRLEVARAEWCRLTDLDHRDLKYEARRALELMAQQV